MIKLRWDNMNFKLKENKGVFLGGFSITSITIRIPFPSLSSDKSLKKESIFRATQTYKNEGHGLQHGGYEVKRMNPKLVNGEVHKILEETHGSTVRIKFFSQETTVTHPQEKRLLMRKEKLPTKDNHDNPNPNHIALHASKQGACSAEAGALAPVFKKLAREPKPNLLRCT